MTIQFNDSVEFGKQGEEILKQYLINELNVAHQQHPFKFCDLTQSRVCQFAGLDFAIKKDIGITSISDLSTAVIDAIEIKSHLWVNFDNHIADLAFEVYSDYDNKTFGWVDKSVNMIEQGILPFTRIFWVNKNNLWVASILINQRFCQFWETDPWKLDHRINEYSNNNNKQWRSSWSPIKVLTLQRECIPYTYFSLKDYKIK